MEAAWHAAALPRMTRFPQLKSLMSKPGRKASSGRQSWQEMAAILETWG